MRDTNWVVFYKTGLVVLGYFGIEEGFEVLDHFIIKLQWQQQ